MGLFTSRKVSRSMLRVTFWGISFDGREAPDGSAVAAVMHMEEAGGARVRNVQLFLQGWSRTLSQGRASRRAAGEVAIRNALFNSFSCRISSS